MISLVKYCRDGQSTDGSTIQRMRCWVTKGIDALRTYFFPTASTVTRMRLSVPTRVHSLSSVTHVSNT